VTDGVLDNLYVNQMTEVINSHKHTNAKKIAKNIAETAFEFSLNKKWKSPFQMEAKNHGFLYKGGKSDDITAVIGLVKIK